MPKVQRIFEQDGEVCVSLGKIEGEGNLVFLTEHERQKMMKEARDLILEDAATYLEGKYLDLVDIVNICDYLRSLKELPW